MSGCLYFGGKKRTASGFWESLFQSRWLLLATGLQAESSDFMCAGHRFRACVTFAQCCQGDWDTQADNKEWRRVFPLNFIPRAWSFGIWCALNLRPLALHPKSVRCRFQDQQLCSLPDAILLCLRGRFELCCGCAFWLCLASRCHGDSNWN